MKQRIYYLDVVRCLACLMVVLMHAPYPRSGMSGLVVVPISLATAPCIGLFFMVSGALLLPTKDNGITFVKKRLAKVTSPILVWTFVAMVINGFTNGWPSCYELFRSLASIPFHVEGHGVMWFMYVLVGMYLIAPIISPWLERAEQRDLQFYLGIWAITMVYPVLKLFLRIDESVTGVLYYFSGYIGYFLFGYYLRKYGRSSTWIALAYLPVPFVLLGICKFSGYEVDFYSVFWYLSFLIASMCWSWFTIIKNAENRISALSPKMLQIIVHFSNCSFGIYLMHIFIMRVGLWQLFDKYHVGGGISLAISFFGTLAISYALSALISYLPFGDWIIGYKRKR